MAWLLLSCHASHQSITCNVLHHPMFDVAVSTAVHNPTLNDITCCILAAPCHKFVHLCEPLSWMIVCTGCDTCNSPLLVITTRRPS